MAVSIFLNNQNCTVKGNTIYHKLSTPVRDAYRLTVTHMIIENDFGVQGAISARYTSGKVFVAAIPSLQSDSDTFVDSVNTVTSSIGFKFVKVGLDRVLTAVSISDDSLSSIEFLDSDRLAGALGYSNTGSLVAEKEPRIKSSLYILASLSGENSMIDRNQLQSSVGPVPCAIGIPSHDHKAFRLNGQIRVDLSKQNKLSSLQLDMSDELGALDSLAKREFCIVVNFAQQW